MKRCFVADVPYQNVPTLDRRANGKFRVTYGAHVRDQLDYAAAATELGSCIMHAVACNGGLDNEE